MIHQTPGRGWAFDTNEWEVYDLDDPSAMRLVCTVNANEDPASGLSPVEDKAKARTRIGLIAAAQVMRAVCEAVASYKDASNSEWKAAWARLTRLAVGAVMKAKGGA